MVLLSWRWDVSFPIFSLNVCYSLDTYLEPFHYPKFHLLGSAWFALHGGFTIFGKRISQDSWRDKPVLPQGRAGCTQQIWSGVVILAEYLVDGCRATGPANWKVNLFHFMAKNTVAEQTGNLEITSTEKVWEISHCVSVCLIQVLGFCKYIVNYYEQPLYRYSLYINNCKVVLYLDCLKWVSIY